MKNLFDLTDKVALITGATSGTGTTLANKLFYTGVTTVTWTATDVCGRTLASVSRIIQYAADTKAPTLSPAPANATVNCTTIPAPAVLTAFDECDP